MTVTVEYPILHARCETCGDRFICLTTKFHDEYVQPQASYLQINLVLPRGASLACFSLTPYENYIYSLTLRPDKDNMVASFNIRGAQV
jgi:hypothetical protein